MDVVQDKAVIIAKKLRHQSRDFLLVTLSEDPRDPCERRKKIIAQTYG
jgi:hypothetical protein